MSSIKVSVVIPVFNCERFIARAIRSLINQSIDCEKYEIIVVNDNSSDFTSDVLEAFKGDIVYIENDSQLGLPASLNKGIKKAKGSYIIRVDADDYVHPDYLRFLALYLELNHDVDAVACDYYIVDQYEDILERVSSRVNKIGCGIMFRYEQLIDIGLYDENFMFREEEELLFRFEKKYTVSHLPLPLYKYRKHSSNMTNNEKMMNIYADKLIEKKKDNN